MSRLLPLSLLLLTGCEQVLEALEELKVPTGQLARVDLLKSPSTNQLASWGCFEVLGIGDTCSLVGFVKPKKADMGFAFDLVFDLSNPNPDVPIPLVELLLGFTVFDGANLGSACLSFCDPAAEKCVPTVDAEGACKTKAADDIREPEDLLPTVEDLLELAQDVAEDGEFGNGEFRTIPGGGDVEAHVQFDLGIDAMLGLADDLLADAADDLLAGRNIKIAVPYTAEGTLFFEAPALGRKGVGFGPLADVWNLQ
ncbi:MAG: hypothetical protein ABMA64_22910 [Myxococcota bacterium]